MTAACATLPAVTTAPGPRGSRHAEQPAAGDPISGVGKPPSAGAAGPGLDPGDLVAATGGTLVRHAARPARGAAVDSRLVTPGNLFVALAGERTDGHRFLADAVARGAVALLVRQAPAGPDLAALGDVTIVRVDDPLTALQAVAAAWRRRFDPLVVGITGSVGKTSTKEATAAVLETALPTLRSEGNQNNEVGLPLTLLRLGPEHRAAVLEMGMYVGGEIATLATIARPEIGVITAVAPVHLERAGSLAAIAAAKAELVESLPADGTAILNADDAVVAGFASRTSAEVVSYGLAAAADVTAVDVEARGAAGMAFTVVATRPRPARFRVEIAALGRHNVANALAAATVGLVAGLDDAAIARGLGRPWGTAAAHRGAIVAAPGLTVLDDTYNASPPAMVAALDVLATLPGRPVAVLGEMLELGTAGPEGHRGVGEAAARVVEELVVVGAGADGIADGARAAGLPAAAIHRAPDRAAAIELLATLLRPGDAVLVKASNGAALWTIVEALQAGAARGASARGAGPATAGGAADGMAGPASGPGGDAGIRS